jgi:hypothetical protein
VDIVFISMVPPQFAQQIAQRWQTVPTGIFDSRIVGEGMFDHPLEIIATKDVPPEKSSTRPLGRHLNGCRVGFDLGGSDRKVAAVIDGRSGFQ